MKKNDEVPFSDACPSPGTEPRGDDPQDRTPGHVPEGSRRACLRCRRTGSGRRSCACGARGPRPGATPNRWIRGVKPPRATACASWVTGRRRLRRPSIPGRETASLLPFVFPLGVGPTLLPVTTAWVVPPQATRPGCTAKQRSRTWPPRHCRQTRAKPEQRTPETSRADDGRRGILVPESGHVCVRWLRNFRSIKGTVT